MNEYSKYNIFSTNSRNTIFIDTLLVSSPHNNNCNIIFITLLEGVNTEFGKFNKSNRRMRTFVRLKS